MLPSSRILLFSLLILFSGVAAASDKYYPFDAKFGEGLAEILHFPECRFEDDTCRRWGIAAEIPVEHRSKNRIDEEYVKRLHSAGINFIRFNSIDSKRNRVFTSWVENKHSVAEKLLAPLDDVIAVMEELDMQYSLSINDGSYKAEYSNAIPNKDTIQHKQYKGSQLTHVKAIKGASAWLKWFYGRPVKNRKFIYGNDPGNRYVTLVGEDSVYYGYFKNDSELLDQNTKDMLSDCLSGKKRLLPYRLPRASELKKQPLQAQRMQNCLSSMDTSYYVELLSPELSAVLPQERATSNAWYGLGYLQTSDQLGSFIDAHAYYDHTVYIWIDGKRVESVRNRSMISEAGVNQHGQSNLLRPNLISLFASSLADKPLYVSEWNHPFWSDYAYEGPLLTAVYASFQDYPLLAIHSLMAWNDDKRSTVSHHGFSAHGNQMLQVMSPILALAYRRGDIEPGERNSAVDAKGSAESLAVETFRVAVDPSRMSAQPEMGLVERYRMSFMNGKKHSNGKREFNFSHINSSTGEISWHFSPVKKAVFSVDAPRFKAVAGPLKIKDESVDMRVTANTHGAILAISTDDKPISDSDSILFAAVSSQQSERMQVKWINKKGFDYPLKAIIDGGRNQVALKHIVADVELHSMLGKIYELYSIDADGTQKKISSIAAVGNKIDFTIGENYTPWYLLIRKPLAKDGKPKPPLSIDIGAARPVLTAPFPLTKVAQDAPALETISNG